MFMVLVAACATNTVPGGDFEVEEKPLTLDEATSLGFSARDVLNTLQAREYVASTVDSAGLWDTADLLVNHGPFEVVPDTTAATATLRKFIGPTGLEKFSVWFRIPVAIQSEDGSFDTAGPLVLEAKAVDDVSWGTEGNAGAGGAMPGWVQAASDAAWAKSRCTPEGSPPAGAQVLVLDGPPSELRLRLQAAWPGACASVGWIDSAALGEPVVP
jgi:hypothetical protein